MNNKQTYLIITLWPESKFKIGNIIKSSDHTINLVIFTVH